MSTLLQHHFRFLPCPSPLLVWSDAQWSSQKLSPSTWLYPFACTLIRFRAHSCQQDEVRYRSIPQLSYMAPLDRRAQIPQNDPRAAGDQSCQGFPHAPGSQASPSCCRKEHCRIYVLSAGATSLQRQGPLEHVLVFDMLHAVLHGLLLSLQVRLGTTGDDWF
jgi:hypothetical protein